MWSLLLFADTREDPLRSPEVIWGVAGITVALLVGAVVIYAVDKWRQSATGSTETDASGTLTSYREMYKNGEITEEEYAELRRRVAEKVKKQLDAKPDAPAAVHPHRAEHGGTHMPPVPPIRPGERATVNPPAPPHVPPKPPDSPGSPLPE